MDQDADPRPMMARDSSGTSTTSSTAARMSTPKPRQQLPQQQQEPQHLTKTKSSRRRHKNSHHGCKNCKQRRIKCDERLPECSQCIKLSQSKQNLGQSYAKCSYLELTREELEALKLKITETKREASVGPQRNSPLSMQPQQSPQTSQPQSQSHGSPRPLNQFTGVGNFEIVVHANKSQFFRKKFNDFRALREYAMTDRKNALSKKSQRLFLGAHLVKMFLLSSVADLYFQSIFCFVCNYLKKILPDSQYYIFHKFALRYFGNSVTIQKLMISNIPKLTQYHFDYLMSSTMILGWSTIYQETELNAYASFTTGILSIISSGMKNNPRSPDDSADLEVAADSIIQAFKSCFVPSYDFGFVKEIHKNLRSLNINQIMSSKAAKAFQNLDGFLQSLMADLEFPDNRSDKMSTYKPRFMYKLVTDWYSIIPSRMFNYHHESFQMDQWENVIYCYYVAISKALQAIIPEVSFVFSLEFMGIGAPQFQRLFTNLTANGTGNEIKYHAMYLSRVYGFFDTRQTMLYDEIYFKSLSILQNDGIYESGFKLENIDEKIISSFNNTVIRPENYPYSNGRSPGNDILFLGQHHDDEENIERLLQSLSYSEVDLHAIHEEEFDINSGFLKADFIPAEDPPVSNDIVSQNDTIQDNLEIVYRIRLMLLHQQS